MTDASHRFDEEKRALRRKLLARRNAIPPETKRAWDAALGQALAAVLRQHDTVLAFYPIGSEPDILFALKECRCRVALPKCVPGTREMRFYLVDNWDKLILGAHGVPEPAPNCALLPVLDQLCIVPGIAFDRQGYRLGYGGGYYDRFLARHSVKTLGACYEILLPDTLPCGEFDVPVAQVYTERRILET